MRSSIKIAVLFFVFLIAAAPAYATTWRVTKTDDTNDGDCYSDCSLREAFDNAADGDSIVFDDSVTGTITLTLGQIDVLNDVTLTGPGEDVLDIQSNGAPNRVFYFIGDEEARFSDLTISHGNTTGYAGIEGASGGCIHNNGVLFLDAVTVENCVSDPDFGYGGGLYINGDTTITNSTIQDNATEDYAGAIFVNSGTLTISDSTIANNDGYNYGGLYNQSTTVLSNVTFSGNVAGNETGAIGNYGTMTIDNASVLDNSSVSIAAGIRNAGTLSVSHSLIGGNTSASSSGGGIFSDGGELTVSNVTLYNNAAAYGGGIAIQGGTATLNNVTVSGNTSTGDGGGLYQDAGTLTIENTVVANNTATGSGPDCKGTITSADYNLIFNTDGCTVTGTTDHNITDTDPELTDLADNGGATQTLALPITSVAVDAGNTSTCANDDQRGNSRASGEECDIGAFEYTFSRIRFSESTYQTSFGDSELIITVERALGDYADAVTVDYATSDLNAVAGTDYTATSGTLSWEADDETAQTITVPILTTDTTTALAFTMTLSDPSTGADLSSETAIATIVAQSPDLAITVTPADTEPTVDETFTYALVVTNTGGDARDLSLQLTASSNQSIATVTNTDTEEDMTCTGTEPLICNIASLDAGATLNLSVMTNIEELGDLTLQADLVLENVTAATDTGLVEVTADSAGNCSLHDEGVKTQSNFFAITAFGMCATLLAIVRWRTVRT